MRRVDARRAARPVEVGIRAGRTRSAEECRLRPPSAPRRSPAASSASPRKTRSSASPRTWPCSGPALTPRRCAPSPTPSPPPRAARTKTARREAHESVRRPLSLDGSAIETPRFCFSSRCVIADAAKLFHVRRNTVRYRSERFAMLSSFPAGCRSSRAHLDASRRRILRRPSAVRSSTRSSLNGFALRRGLAICVQTWDLKPLALAAASDEPGILSTSIGAEAFKENIWLTRTR